MSCATHVRHVHGTILSFLSEFLVSNQTNLLDIITLLSQRTG
jgi:hypothetical protein